MALKMTDIAFGARLPEVPAAMPVFALAAPSLADRQGAIKRLGEYLKLDTLRSAELDHATVMASERGDIHFFHASGAVMARDACADRDQPDEMRKWEGLERPDRAGKIALNADAAKRLLAGARELLEPIGLIGREAASSVVQLDQVAQCDARGRQIAQGVGQATAKFTYAVEGVPARGAGAKTLAFADPVAGGAPRFTGMFHAWRQPGNGTKVRLGGLEAGLAAGLMTDPELDLYFAAGHKIEVTRIELVYLALPAFMRQSHLFPAFQVEGTVSEGRRGAPFNFGRFHHAAPPAAYRAADLAGQYLMANPDGIRPLPQPRQQAA